MPRPVSLEDVATYRSAATDGRGAFRDRAPCDVLVSDALLDETDVSTHLIVRAGAAYAARVCARCKSISHCACPSEVFVHLGLFAHERTAKCCVLRACCAASLWEDCGASLVTDDS